MNLDNFTEYGLKQIEIQLKIIATLKPKLSRDGNQFCFLWGSNPMEGCAGYGDTIAEAMYDFCEYFFNQKIKEPENITQENIAPGTVLNENFNQEELNKIYKQSVQFWHDEAEQLQKELNKASDQIAKRIQENCALKKEKIELQEFNNSYKEAIKLKNETIQSLENDIKNRDTKIHHLTKEITEYKAKENTPVYPKPGLIYCDDDEINKYQYITDEAALTSGTNSLSGAQIHI